MSSGTIMSVSDSLHINMSSGPATSPMKDQTINSGYPVVTGSFSLQPGQPGGQPFVGDSFPSASVGDSVPNLDGPFHESHNIAGTVQQQNILGSVQQDVTCSADVSAKGRMSTDSYPPLQNVSNTIQHSDSALNTILQSPGNASVQSPEGQMSAGTFLRQNSSFGSLESSSPPVVGSQIGSSQNPLTSPNTSSQISTNQMTSTLQQGNSIFSQSQQVQGTSVAVSQTASTMAQPGKFYYLNCDVRKSIFGVSDNVKFKPACSASDQLE